MKKFSVTYERWMYPTVADGETIENGFVVRSVSLREAIEVGLELRDLSQSGVCELIYYNELNQWITFYEWNASTREETGIIETRSLRIPKNVTEASRARILRLFTRNPKQREACDYAKRMIEECKQGLKFEKNHRAAMIETHFALRELVKDRRVQEIMKEMKSKR